MTELPEDWNARHRQATSKINKALGLIKGFKQSLGPYPPHMEPWTITRLNAIEEATVEAYDLMALLVEPDDLLDEMATL